MQLISNTVPKILLSEDGYLLKSKNDNGEVLEDGTIVEPYLTDRIFLGKQIETLEQCEDLYEEIKKEE